MNEWLYTHSLNRKYKSLENIQQIFTALVLQQRMQRWTENADIWHRRENEQKGNRGRIWASGDEVTAYTKP